MPRRDDDGRDKVLKTRAKKTIDFDSFDFSCTPQNSLKLVGFKATLQRSGSVAGLAAPEPSSSAGNLQEEREKPAIRTTHD